MNATKPLLIVLLGPTASGKTALGIEIAETMNLNIHNIDSRQLYIGMDIGTAKPTKEQRDRVKHFLINLSHPNKPVNLFEFQQLAQKSLNSDFEQEKKTGFLVGGSGLYLKSITRGLMPPQVPPQKFLREQLNRLGQSICYQMLEKCDPLAAKKISSADMVRTIRALEVFYATGRPISEQRKTDVPAWKILELGLNPKNLEDRIQKRTKWIYENGLVEETQLLSKKFGADLPLLQTIGYKEALSLLRGEVQLDQAMSLTIRRTKQFAKKQRTWFRKQHNPIWLNDEQPLREALSLIQTVLG